jgi:hypothetical protein
MDNLEGEVIGEKVYEGGLENRLGSRPRGFAFCEQSYGNLLTRAASKNLRIEECEYPANAKRRPFGVVEGVHAIS